MTRREGSWWVLLPALALLGCGSSGEEPEPETPSDKVEVKLTGPREQRLDFDEFEYEWADLDSDARGRKDSYDVARWVTERHNAALRCLQAEPPAITQAVDLLEEILRRVPDSSKVRFLAAQTQFSLAAYWFRAADAIHYDMAWVDYKHELPPSKGGAPLTEEEIDEFFASAEPQFQAALERLHGHARQSLGHYLRYRTQRPDDKSIADKLWRLYFFLQDYTRSLDWLNYVLAEMDVAEMPEEEPLRREYTQIRRMIQRHLAEASLQREGQPPRGGVFPWMEGPGAEGRRQRIGGMDQGG